MDRFQNKIAIVTGASSGIGAVCALELVRSGMIVFGLARGVDDIVRLRDQLPQHLRARLYAMKCDVTCETDILKIYTWIDMNFSGVHILVNCAGVLRPGQLTAANNTTELKEILDTNVLGVVICTREAFRSMKKHNIDGHIIIINSVLGHAIPQSSSEPMFGIYPASKYALKAVTEVFRQEFVVQNTKVKITSISPGTVNTEGKNLNLSPDVPFLRPEDIVDAILYCLKTPPNVQIFELVIKPVGEMF